LAACLACGSLFAQKAPELGYAFPPGARAGTTVEVALGGYDFTPETDFFCHTPGVRLTILTELGDPITQAPPYWFGPRGRAGAMPIPREFRARLELSEDLPAGPIYWQAANANGASATASFWVSRPGDGVEVIEKRWRDDPQALATLPAIVSGRLGLIAEVDKYSIVAKADGPISLDLFARRIGTDVHGVLRIHDADGRLLADVADTEGVDAALTFAAKKGERYTISVHDLDFRGHRSFVYRLGVRAGPRVLVTMPARGRRGTTQDLHVLGVGLETGTAKLERVTHRVSFPDGENDSITYRLASPFGETARVEVASSNVSEAVDISEDDSEAGDRAKARELSIPGAMTRRMISATEHCYSFVAKKGDAWNVSVEARAIGSSLDIEVAVHSEDGKQLAKNDDANGSTDAELAFKVPSDGKFFVTVGEISGKAGAPDAIYRLAIDRPQPGLELSIPPQLKISAGGKASLKVTAKRHGGLAGAIALTLSGLPDGFVAAEKLEIPAGKSDLTIPIEATAAAGTPAALLRVRGVLRNADTELAALATAPAGGHRYARRPGSHRVPSCLLATTMAPPFSFDVIGRQRQRAVHRGTTYPAPIVVERKAGFDGEIELHMLAKQGRHRQGIFSPMIAVPPGVDRVPYPIFLPEWLETDRTTRMVVLGMAKVPDAKGRVRYLTKPITSRITMILEGAVLKLARERGQNARSELTGHVGSVVEVPVRVQRAAKFEGPVVVDLVPSGDLAPLVESESFTVAADSSSGVVRVATKLDARLVGDWKWTVRATGKIDGRWPAISDLEVPVTILPATTAKK